MRRRGQRGNGGETRRHAAAQDRRLSQSLLDQARYGLIKEIRLAQSFAGEGKGRRKGERRNGVADERSRPFCLLLCPLLTFDLSTDVENL